MAWIKVPPEHHPIFHAALPQDLRVETMKMFGGVAAKVNGNIFAGLFGRSTILCLPEPLKSQALALEGAGPFDPMGDGRAMSDKVMLPESMMEDPDELRRWIGLAFEATAALPPKAPKPPKRLADAKTAAPKPKRTGATTAAKRDVAARISRARASATAKASRSAAKNSKPKSPKKPAAKKPAAKRAKTKRRRGSA